MNNITLGRFMPGDSFVHGLDPRTKLIITILYMVMVFCVDNILFFIPVFFYLVLMIAKSQVPVRYIFQSLKPLKWILILMFILNLFMIDTGKMLLDLHIMQITTDGILRAFFIIIRLALVVCGTSILTLTTAPVALTDGLETLLRPLKKIKFPVHELSMMMTIALRFIPTLLDETDRIKKAQAARGADFETGGLIKRAKAMLPIMIPLFISAFKRADELALAMDSRCYHGDEGRTRMKQLKFSRNDAIAGIFSAVFLALLIVAMLIIK